MARAPGVAEDCGRALAAGAGAPDGPAALRDDACRCGSLEGGGAAAAAAGWPGGGCGEGEGGCGAATWSMNDCIRARMKGRRRIWPRLGRSAGSLASMSATSARRSAE